MRRIGTTLGLLLLLVVSFALSSPAAASTFLGFSTTTPSVPGGKSAFVTVKLDAVGSSNVVVALTNSDTTKATVPASVTIFAGKISANVTVKTMAVTAPSSFTITGSAAGVTKSISISVVPSKLLTFTVPKTLVAGTTGSASVALDGLAPTGGLVVSLSSNNSGVTVPSSVTILAKASTARFSVVAATGTAGESATLTATLGSVTKTGTVSLGAAGLYSVIFSPSTVAPGATSTGSVKLNGPAGSGGTTVTLSVPTGSPLTIPASVTIASGTTSKTFSATGKTVSVSTKVTVSATANGITKSGSVTVVPAGLSSIAFSSTSVKHGAAATGKVTLTKAAPTGGATVSLSADSTMLSVPSSVTVPAGATSATFTATAGSPLLSTKVTVSASYAAVTKTSSITVKALAAYTLAFSPATVDPSGTSTGTVTLDDVAPAGGATVTLVSTSSYVTVPASVIVPAGSNKATFTATAGSPSSQTIVPVRATYGGIAKTGNLTVRATAPSVAIVVVYPNPVGGQALVGIGIQLSSPASTGGLPITFASNNLSVLSFSGSYTVPAGYDFVTLFPTTSAVSAETHVTISASGGGTTASADLTVYPFTVSQVQQGAGSNGVVQLSGLAPAGGAVVALTSSNPAATVPANVTIPAGSTSVTFPISNQTTSAQSVTVTASANSTSASHAFIVQPVQVSQVSFPDVDVFSGNTVTGTVYLTGNAPAGGVTVTLTSGDPTVATPPASVTVPAGQSSVTFPVVLHATDTYHGLYITAAAGGTSAQQLLAIHELRVSTMTFAANPVVSGDSVDVTITLTGVVETGSVAVGLYSFNADAAPVPASVEVAAGSDTVTFTMQTNPVDVTTDVLFYVSLNSNSAQVTLQLTSAVTSSEVDESTPVPTVEATAAPIEEATEEAALEPTVTATEEPLSAPVVDDAATPEAKPAA